MLLTVLLGFGILFFCAFFAYFFSMVFSDIHTIYFFTIALASFFYLVVGGLVALGNDETQKYIGIGKGFPGVLTGCLIMATYLSTGAFLVEADMAYKGFFPMYILASIMVCGYFLSNAFFARYAYRAADRTHTLGGYCTRRFCSENVGRVWLVINMITLTVYLVSVTISLGALIGRMTGFNHTWCGSVMLFAVMCGVLITGNRGLAVVEAIMGSFVFVASIIGIGLFIKGVGNGSWNAAFANILNSVYHDFVTWKGAPVMYSSVGQRYSWGIYQGLLLMSLAMAAPWQVRCFIAAKNEREMTKGFLTAAIMVFVVWFFAIADGVFLRGTPAHVLPYMTTVMVDYPGKYMPIWAGMLILTSIMTAGVSSMAIFLGHISEGVAGLLFIKQGMSDKQKGHIARLTIVLVTLMVWLLSLIAKITMRNAFFATLDIIASVIVPLSLVSVWSKKLTKQGAVCGSLAAFFVVIGLDVYYVTNNIPPYIWLLPAYVGVAVNLFVMWIVSKHTQVTEEEKAFRESMFVIPEEEKTPEAMKQNLFWSRLSILIGPLATLFLIVMWAWPVFKATH